MAKISIHMDSQSGLLKCQITPTNNILSDFFESEIQEDPAFIHYLKQSIDKLSNGSFEINGNAHCLKVTKTVYAVTPLYQTVSTWVMGPISDFTFFLDEWEKALISRNTS
ncbi:MAG: hypothetical protein V7723_09960 [Sneathiella sp.]|uniref:hypothetical protein n=1 Tax=Sneathiella sp. TaxID=1964365 RepID=UPI003002A6DE